MNATHRHGGGSRSPSIEPLERGLEDHSGRGGREPGPPAVAAAASSAGRQSALARLAAGVGHEIDHPCEVIRVNGETIETYLLALTKLVRAYERAAAAFAGHDTPAVMEQLRRIEQLRAAEDVAFILDDVRGLLRESRECAGRLQGLAGRLTAFSRDDPPPEGPELGARVDETVRPTRVA